MKYAGKTLEKHLPRKATNSGSGDRHEHGVRFLIYKDTVNAIMGGRPVSSRLITIRLKVSPFNITIIKTYAPTTDYDDDDIEDVYDQLQGVIDQAPKKNIIVVQCDWNAKIEEDASKNWKGTCGQYCNPETNERGLRLLEIASYNTTWRWWTHLVHTNLLDGGHGTAQEETTTIRSTTSWSNDASSQVWTSQRPGAFQEPILEVTTSLKWWPPDSASKGWKSRATQG